MDAKSRIASNPAAKILVVDDNPDVLTGLCLFLKNAGYATLSASNGQSCLALVKAERPDLVLLDVELPDCSGLEICQRIKGDPELAHTFVIHISGAYTSSKDQVEGLGAGADGYIVKSIHPQELIARVEALLRIAVAEKALRTTHAELEKRVAERTAALETLNQSLLNEIGERQRAEEALRVKSDQLRAVTDAMTAFLHRGNWPEAGEMLLRSALKLTASEYGFLGELAAGSVLRVLAHAGVVWDATINREFYEQAQAAYRDAGFLEFSNLNNLFGHVITSRQPVLSNDPEADPRSGGLPAGHPPLRAFLGVPILHGTEVVGMISVANRPGGYSQEELSRLVVLAQTAGLLYDSHRRQQRTTALAVERRAAVEQIGESRRQYRELVESLDGIIWEADAQTFQFTFVSPHCERLLGYTVEEWMAQMTWQKLIHPDDLNAVFAECSKAVQAKRNHSLEYRVLAADGHLVWVRDIATVVVKNGQAAKLIGVLLDVTERKAAEAGVLTYQRQLRTLASEMERAEERERRRIAVDLHDHIGQTLALAKIKLDEMSGHVTSADSAQTLGVLQGLIQQTILDARSLLFEISPPVLHELGLGAALECLAEQFQTEHRLRIDFQEDREPKPLAHDARALLYKAVRELLLNVIKHARARQVTVSLSRTAGQLCVMVADDGVGFDVSAVQSYSGRISGFGLFNLRERLDYNGGTLEMDSQPGRGTRITILFPLEK